MASAARDRSEALQAVLLAGILLVFSTVYSAAAPVGRWENRIFDTPVWGEADPGT